eukprot:5521520-Pyramimonas_sp.AAC.1
MIYTTTVDDIPRAGAPPDDAQVEEGETAWALASQRGMTVRQVASLNGLQVADLDGLQAGQRLWLLVGGNRIAVHTVRKGETVR